MQSAVGLGLLLLLLFTLLLATVMIRQTDLVVSARLHSEFVFGNCLTDIQFQSELAVLIVEIKYRPMCL